MIHPSEHSCDCIETAIINQPATLCCVNGIVHYEIYDLDKISRAYESADMRIVRATVLSLKSLGQNKSSVL